MRAAHSLDAESALPWCACPAVLRKRVVSVDFTELQPVHDVSAAITKIPVAAWPAGGRVDAMWIDPMTAEQFGLTTSQLHLFVGTSTSQAAFVSGAPLSVAAPTLHGFEGRGLGPSSGQPLDGDLVVRVDSDYLTLDGVQMGHIDIHVVVSTPGSF